MRPEISALNRVAMAVCLPALTFYDLAPAAHAEPDGTREQSLRFETIAKRPTLNAILQDRDGFWWLATQSGLVKYNGYDFQRYSVAGHSLTGDYVTALYEDREGILWIGTTSGLSSYDKATDSFTQHKHDPHQPESISNDNMPMYHPQSIVQDREGAVWIGTRDGLNRYDKSEERFTRYTTDPTDPTSLSDSSVGAITKGGDGFLWVATASAVHKFDPIKGTVIERYLSDNDDPTSLHGGDVTAVMAGSDGTIWVGTREAGVQKLDPAEGRVTHYVANPEDASRLSSNFVTSMIERPNGELWITTFDGGLNLFDPDTETFSRYQFRAEAYEPDGVSSNNLMNIVTDSSGAVWIANLGGEMDRYDPAGQRFKTMRHAPGVRNSVSKGSYIGEIIEDRTGMIWIAIAGAGLDRYDRNTGEFTHYRHAPDDPKSLPESYGQALIEDAQGNLWMTSINWIVLIDRDTGRAKETYPAKDWPASPIEDRGDPALLWFSTSGSGLLKFNKQTGETTYFEPDPSSKTSVSADTAYSIYQDYEGFIWIASLGGGLDRFDPRTEKVVAKYKHDPDDPTTLDSNTLYQFFRDSSGTYWVTSEAGLNRFDPNTGTFRRFSERDGTFPLSSAGQIAEFPAGHLWIARNGGIVGFDPKTGDARLYATDIVRDGTFRPLVTKDGEVWFYANAIVRFHPEAITEQTTSIPVYITSLMHRGKPLELGTAPEQTESIRLDWRDNSFEFEFAALDYRKVGDIRYRYRLQGVDADWYEAGTTRRGRYAGLKGGNYTLEVMAADKDGVWGEQAAVLTVVVDSPPWQTWWALLLYAVMGLAAMAFYVRYHTRALRAQVRAAQQLGSYTLIEKIGEGGMGVVYRAKHAMLRRPTAMKLLPIERLDDDSVRRFEREVQLTSELNHPNIVSVYDYGQSSSGVFYYAMEYLDGATLQAVVELDGPQPPARVVKILGQVAEALAEAHAVNLIHRDIKPANIMLVEQGARSDVAKVLDFGIVKELDPEAGAMLTHDDSITGTPMYLSPETLSAPGSVDARSDIYALGAVGYFLLTGKHIFTGETLAEVCAAHLHSNPVPPSERIGEPLPADLEALILRCLAKDPGDRPQSAAILRDALRACKDVGNWSNQDAHAWWERYKPSIVEHRQREPGLEYGLTLMVDPERRRPVH